MGMRDATGIESAPCFCEPEEKPRMHVLPVDSAGLSGKRIRDMLAGGPEVAVLSLSLS